MTVLTSLDNMPTFHAFDLHIRVIISKYQRLQDYRTQTVEEYKHIIIIIRKNYRVSMIY